MEHLKGYRPEGKVLSPLKSIRKHCVTCMGFMHKQVKICDIEDCWLWPYRLGTKPPKGSDDPRESAVTKKTPL